MLVFVFGFAGKVMLLTFCLGWSILRVRGDARRIDQSF